MSGRPLTIRLEDGTEYEVPEENAEAAMRRFDQLGVKFSADNAAPPEPEAPRGGTAPFVEPDPSLNPNDQSNWLRGLSQADKDGFRAGAEAWQRAADNPSAMVAHNLAPLGGLITGGGGFLGSLAGNALGAGVTGSLENYAQDPESGAGEAVRRAAPAAALGGLVGGASHLGGKIAGGLGDAAEWVSGKARNAIFGNPSAYNRMAQNQGLDAVRNVGQVAEDLGVTNRWRPQDAGDYADRLVGSGAGIGGRAGEAGQKVAQHVAEADAQLAPGFVDKAALVSSLRQQQGAAARSGAGDAASEAASLGAVAQGMDGRTINTPTDLWKTKSFYDQRAYPDAVAGSPEGFMGQAHAAAGNTAREQLRDVMQYTLPDTQQGFAQASSDYGSALNLGKLAQQRAATQEAGGFSKSNVISRYAPDAIANLSARAGEGLDALAGGANWIARDAPTGAATAYALQGAMGGPKPKDAARDQQQSMKDGRGYLAPSAIQRALQSAPQMLGPYAEQLSQAKDEEELEAMVERLTRTDPRFASQVLPRFQTGR